MRFAEDSLYLRFNQSIKEIMRKGFNILLILCTSLAVVSCGKTKSYTDMLNDEKEAVERLIDAEGFEILKDFPEDSVFAENQFVKLESGVYLNIIDKGSDQRAVKYKTKILYRCIVSYPLDSTYINSTPYYVQNYGPHSNGTSPWEFTYGDYATSNAPYFVSEGVQEPLEYVGDGAKVKLIVPFKRGTYNDQSNGQPAYYETLVYLFEENL